MFCFTKWMPSERLVPIWRRDIYRKGIIRGFVLRFTESVRCLTEVETFFLELVDSDICHPTVFDFYLCCRAGIKGTSRPKHYHVPYDEKHFTANTLQSLTNHLLCFMILMVVNSDPCLLVKCSHARCTRAVPVVRAHYYVEGESSDGGLTPYSCGMATVAREGPVEAILSQLPKIS